MNARSTLGAVPHVAMIAAAVWIAVAIFRRGRNLARPSPTAPTTEVLAYERSQLEHQRSLLASVRVWYLAPIAATAFVTFAVTLSEHREALSNARSAALLGGAFAFCVAVLAVIDRLNARAAAALSERIARLG